MTFRQAFCQKYAVPDDDYTQKVFRLSLHLHARPLAKIISWVLPHHFEEDFAAIQELATITDIRCFEPEVGRFRGRNQRSKSFLRRHLKMRVSGRRLIKLKDSVYTTEANPES